MKVRLQIFVTLRRKAMLQVFRDCWMRWALDYFVSQISPSALSLKGLWNMTLEKCTDCWMRSALNGCDFTGSFQFLASDRSHDFVTYDVFGCTQWGIAGVDGAWGSRLSCSRWAIFRRDNGWYKICLAACCRASCFVAMTMICLRAQRKLMRTEPPYNQISLRIVLSDRDQDKWMSREKHFKTKDLLQL